MKIYFLTYFSKTWQLIFVLQYIIHTINAQSIAKAEYYIDTDPGQGAAISLSPTTDTFIASIPTAGLSAGFHNLVIRAKDGTNWSMQESRTFYISTSTANVTDISSAEFFIDVDPGQGAGAPIAASGSTASFTIPITTTALLAGFHNLVLRAKGADGVWGLQESRSFYISNSSANVTDMSAAEFFIDVDPGQGAGTPITASGSTASFTIPIPTFSLSPGFHNLVIRAKGADGKWGLHENRSFYISTSTSNVPDMSVAEYFIDVDPGQEAGTPIAASGSTTSFTIPLPTALLSEGFHNLVIRAKGADGKWGFQESRMFYISTQTANMPNIVGAEWFLDHDPGVGLGTQVAFANPGSRKSGENAVNLVEIINLAIPANTSPEDHILVMRVKNAVGNYSLYETPTLVTIGPALPLRLLSFSGKKTEQGNKLSWTTSHEVNTASFEIERSKDGRNFEKIGEVNSKNNVERNNYEYFDFQNGQTYGTYQVTVFYYRLKQIDLDGSFVHSKILAIFFENIMDNLTVFPNPTSDYIKLNFAQKEKYSLVHIYNALGQKVLSKALENTENKIINVSEFVSGKYFLQINDGIFSRKAVFIKN